MKKTISLIFICVICLCVTSCVTSSSLTKMVSEWFNVPSVSSISYDLGGITGEAQFTYYTENNNTVLFTSGEGLGGVEFTFRDGTVTASRSEDGISWEVTPEMAETLSMFGKLYGYAANLTYSPVSDSKNDENTIVNSFDYTDGKCEITISKENGKPLSVVYTQDEETVKLVINDITPIIEDNAEEQ